MAPRRRACRGAAASRSPVRRCGPPVAAPSPVPCLPSCPGPRQPAERRWHARWAMETTAYGAIVLAGGGARRMGGVRKPAVQVGGVPMIERVLAAVTPAGAPLVVGPSDLVLPPGV